jgi:GT2 family glycosyltransferase
MVDVSIIIVAWSVRELLHNCLKSVYEKTEGINFEVIYVDNGSEDGSVEMVKKEFPEVIIIENDENKGFIIANNQAIEIAKGRYVLLLNSDTIILNNAIAKSVEFADANPEAAVVGCRTLNPDGTLQRSAFMYPSLLNMFLSATYLYKCFPRSRFFGREMMTWYDFNDVKEVEAVRGCFALVRRKAFGQIGLMDDVYFVYGDDIDWCYRFRKAGWKIMFTPVPEIIHYGGQTTTKMPSEFAFQLFGSKLLFLKIHRNKFEFLLARFLIALYMLMRIPYWIAKAIFSTSERKWSMQRLKIYSLGSFYSLTDWKKLLMNKDVVGGDL